MISPSHRYIESDTIFWRKIKKIYSEGKLKTLDLKRNVSRNFETVRDNIIKYVNARYMNYKGVKVLTSFAFIQ